MLNLNINYSNAVILSSAKKRKATIEELREKCIDNSKTEVVYDAKHERVIFCFSYFSTIFNTKEIDENVSITIVADKNVSAEAYAKNKSAYLQALHGEVNSGNLDEFICTKSDFISKGLTNAHAERMMEKVQ